MKQADLIIVGAGPGGYEVAAEQAARGLKVVLIERDQPGGTCLNRGCIPTKCLCASAEAVRAVANAADFGVNVTGYTPDYAAAHQRMTDIVDQLREGVAQSLSRCELVKGEASVTPDGHIAVGDEVYSAPKILIATGSKPARMAFDPEGLCLTSDEFLQLPTLPESMVIIGGGVIGIEFADILNAFGVQVTVVEYCKEILPPFDPEIAKRLRTTLSRRGVEFVLGASVTSVGKAEGEPGADSAKLTVSYEGKRGSAQAVADCVLCAVGRRPVLPDGLADAGIEVNGRGFIVTDATMQTTRPGVYAVGDCNGRCMLAHAATAQARVALGEDVDLSVIPSAVYTEPPVAMCGMTPQAAADAGIEVRAVKSLFGANGRAQTMGQASGLVKTLYNAGTGAVIGCHIMGPHADDLVQQMVPAIAQGMTAAQLRRFVVGHPTLSEVLSATFAD